MPQEPNDSAPRFTLRQRAALWLISTVGYLAIRIICSTLRFSISSEDNDPEPKKLPGIPAIAPFWHNAVFTATYYFRNRACAVMTSRSFDGEYIARIISKFGFVPVRGSSSRGAVAALREMHSILEEGMVAAFTIDGPRGPKYVAKPGPLLLARNSGAPIRCMYVAVSDSWKLNSWDGFIIPKPFARAHVRWSVPLLIPPDADVEDSPQYLQQMQAALERVTAFAEEAVRAAH